MAERGARERCGVGVMIWATLHVLAPEILKFFFAFDAKSYVLWVAKKLCVVGSKEALCCG